MSVPLAERFDELVPLPAQPDGLPWPTTDWQTASMPDLAAEAFSVAADRAFDPDGPLAITSSLLAVQHGRIVYERYDGRRPEHGAPDEPVTVDTPMLSWSMAKSVLHIAIGILVEDGTLQLHAPAPVAEWASDERRNITLHDLLTMSDGLDFVEDYVTDGGRCVIDMLFGEGAQDVATYASAAAAGWEPGTRLNYSSGTSNIVSGILSNAVDDVGAFLESKVFGPLGMASAAPKFDPAGTWVASSFLHATTRDFAKFGLLALRGGEWDGQTIVEPSWIDHGRLRRRHDANAGRWYGAHWWCEADGRGTFACSGYEGQSITITPPLDLVVVRFGRTPASQTEQLRSMRRSFIDAFDPERASHV